MNRIQELLRARTYINTNMHVYACWSYQYTTLSPCIAKLFKNLKMWEVYKFIIYQFHYWEKIEWLPLFQRVSRGAARGHNSPLFALYTERFLSGSDLRRRPQESRRCGPISPASAASQVEPGKRVIHHSKVGRVLCDELLIAYVCMYACICLFIDVWMCLHLCTYMYVCMYVFIYVYTYIHTYIHTYLLRNAESAALHKANTAVVPAVCEAMQAADVHGIESCQALVVVGDVVGEHPKRFAFQYRHSKP